jgi:serine/threonine kinase 32
MSFYSFTDNPFFRPLDFDALERKEIEPVFVPSSEKTNFDATYDLEELLLEEAPLEARARRQKPREQLKDDATDKEIREEELYKMIETNFKPFDYTKAAYDRYADGLDPNSPLPLTIENTPQNAPQKNTQGSTDGHPPSPATHRSMSTRRRRNSKSQPSSRSGSPHSVNAPPMPAPPTSQPKPQPAPINSGNNRSPTSNPGSHVPAPLSPYQQSYNRPQRPTGTRNQSVGGGMQVVLDGTGSWSQLAKQDATLPADAKLAEVSEKATGMIGFLTRKKG